MRLPGIDDDGHRPDLTADAVILVPGIMGTELVERDTGRMVWGLRDPRWYARAWHSDQLTPLAVTQAEQDALAAGRYDPETARLRPGRLLRAAASLPVLRGVEPYTTLRNDLRRLVVAPEAIAEFGYDWRLPVSFNARLLAEAIRTQLTTWRQHPALRAWQRDRSSSAPVGVVVVAHSMGGLLAQELTRLREDPDLTEATRDALGDIRMTITLGTPFHGSVKAAVLLNTGRGAPLPLPRESLRDVVATMPGVHDLLPFYRCLRIEDGPSGLPDVIRPEATEFADLGANPDLATRAVTDHETRVQLPLLGHRLLYGTEQPTPQSMTLRDGVVGAENHMYERDDTDELVRTRFGQLIATDARGDGTVYRYAAALPGVTPDPGHLPMVQSHSGLARASEVLGIIRGWVTQTPAPGAKLGTGDVGLDIPDVVLSGEEITLVVTGEDDPGQVTVTLEQVEEQRDVLVWDRRPARSRSTEGLRLAWRMAEPGLYRVSARTGGSEPVTQLVICEDADA